MLKTYISKKIRFLIGLIILLLLFVSGFYLYKKIGFNRQRNQAVTKKLLYQNPELGISFEYPASWGNANTLATGTVFSSLIKISFPSKPNVILYSTFNHMDYAYYEKYSDNQQHYAWDYDEGYYMYSSGSLKDFCTKKTLDESGPLIGSAPEKHSDGVDEFRFQGVYIYGKCSDFSSQLHVGFKNGSTEIRSFFDKNDTRVIPKPISLYNYYYWALDTPSYQGLNLKVSELGFTTYQYCTHEIGKNNIVRVDRCINYEDKSNIENAFQSIENSTENAEILGLVHSLKTFRVDSNSFTQAFSKISEYSDKTLPLKFVYPSVLYVNTSTPSEVLDDIIAVSSAHTYPGYTSYVSIIKTTRERAQAQTKFYQIALGEPNEGEGPLPPSVSVSQFDADKKILEEHLPGDKVDCPKVYDSMLSYDPIQCEVITLDSIPAIKRYYYPSPWDRYVAVEYTLYLGEKRIDIESQARGVDVNDYDQQEKKNTQTNFRIHNQVLRSIEFK